MSALRWALRHPANRGRGAWVLRRWLGHQVRKRLRLGAPTSRRVPGGVIVGPAAHPTICLATYVHNGLTDVDAFIAYAAILEGGDHFLDVGAGIGLHAVAASRLTGPQGRIVCVEPDPFERAWLARTRLANAATWGIDQRPLADRARPLAWRSAGATTAHLTQPSAPGSDPILETTTLDEVVTEFALDPNRLFIKIDVEGWEPAVLTGGRATIESGVKGLWIEANGLQHRCDVPWEEAVAAIGASGYRPFVVNIEARRVEPVPQPVPRTSRTGNYLFVAQEALVHRLELLLLEWERSLCEWQSLRSVSPLR